MKKGLLIVAAVLMLAGAVQAGELKVHNWPCTFVAKQFMTIPVTMDVGYYILVKSQSKYTIHMDQLAPDKVDYAGCVTIPVMCNFPATLTLQIAKFTANGDAVAGGGSLKAYFSNDPTITSFNITAIGTTQVQICASLTNAQIGNLTGGQNNVHVADVTVFVVPTAGAIPCTTQQ